MQKDAPSAVRPLRPPQDNIPPTKHQRDGLARMAGEYVRQNKPVGPLSIGELRTHARAVLKAAGLSRKYLEFAGVLVNNKVWRSTVAGIPFEKRLLLLPKCLRDADSCPAQCDEVGLLCEHCGRCIINDFKSQAERLGYAVLVAEGSPVVMSLIETGKVEAVVGVSCLSVLERVFPYMEAGAVPGIAVPLLRDGCSNTSVDHDLVWDAIYLNSDDQRSRLNLETLRQQVNGWFSKASLAELLSASDDQTESLALEWMAGHGKRWRPFLVACAYQALVQDKERPLPSAVHDAAVAVECFHKASLIHDDIEDADDLRYGQETLHAEHGIPVALNVGDFLLGEGYRLLVELDASAPNRTQMLAAAVHGHRSLCLGQGSELSWMRRPGPLNAAEVIDIFAKKTSPAFEVALKMGAILAGHSGQLSLVLEEYSRSLGVAYQIRDDIEDFRSMDESDALSVVRPSLLLAKAYEWARDADKKQLESVWNRSSLPNSVVTEVREVLVRLEVERAALDLMESYKSRAIGCLYELRNADLKGLLRRVIGKIFNDFEVMGCCNDYKAGHAQGGESGEGSSE